MDRLPAHFTGTRTKISLLKWSFCARRSGCELIAPWVHLGDFCNCQFLKKNRLRIKKSTVVTFLLWVRHRLPHLWLIFRCYWGILCLWLDIKNWYLQNALVQTVNTEHVIYTIESEYWSTRIINGKVIIGLWLILTPALRKYWFPLS